MLTEQQRIGELTGQILEAVEQGRLAVESLTASIELRSDLTNDEQVSIHEALAILKQAQQSQE